MSHPAATHDQLRQPAGTEVDQKLTDLVDGYGLDPNLADHFSPEGDARYQSAGLAPSFRDSLSRLRLESLTELQEKHDFVYGKNVIERGLERASRGDRRRAVSPAFARRMGGTVVGHILSTPEGRQWADEIEKAADDGLGVSQLVQALGTANNLHYASQVDWCDEPLDEKHREALTGLMGVDPADIAPDTSMRDIAATLQETEAADLSKETLDARVEQFAAAAQVEAASMFLDGLIDTNMLAGIHAKQARWLAARYKDTLLLDDYDLKIEMMDAMGRMYHDFALRERHPRVKELLQARADWAYAAAQDLGTYLDNFGTVYESLGYEPHPLLTPDDEATEATIHQLPLPGQKTGEAERETATALRSEIETELLRVNERAAALTRAWRMSGHERRSRGFSTMYRELVGGFRNFAGQQLMERMDKPEAQSYIDIAAHLYDLSDGEGSRGRLAASRAELASVNEDLELLQMYARELGIRISRPDLPPVEKVTAEITANWDKFRQVALKTWPGQEGVVVAQRLERLLFDAPQPVEDDQLTQEAVRQQLEMAEYLDKIVLPPDATMEDVQRVLDRLGVEGISLDIFEYKRLMDLVKLREEFGGVLYRTKDIKKDDQEPEPAVGPQPEEELEYEPAKGMASKRRKKKQRAIEDDPSYWIVTFDFEGDRFVIAESSFTNHASFVICDRLIETTALQVLGVGRRQAPSHGAEQVIHSANAKLSHRERLQNKVLELHAKPARS